MSDDEGGLDDGATTEAIIKELQRTYSRMENANDSTTTVIQFIVLVFGAAALIADKFPAAIVAMPAFWTVWQLYAQLTDHNTLKYSAVARHLEELANSRLELPVFVWETHMAARGNKRPAIFWVNYAYWAVLNAAAWIIAIVVLHREGYDGWIWVIATAWGVTWAAGLWSSVVLRERYLRQYTGQLQSLVARADRAE